MDFVVVVCAVFVVVCVVVVAVADMFFIVQVSLTFVNFQEGTVL
jgi:hypothetical protein